MGDDARGTYRSLDQNIAANVREYRESRGLSQDELAQRMTDRGFGFSQATIWKIESGQRPVKLSEAAALANALEIPGFSAALGFLLDEPETSRHRARLQFFHRKAHDAYEDLKAAAGAYLKAQVELVFTVRDAHDAGAPVSELWTSWLDIPAERAVIEVRHEGEQHDKITEQIDDDVDKVMQALRDRGYEPKLRPEDIEEVEPDGPSAG